MCMTLMQRPIVSQMTDFVRRRVVAALATALPQRNTVKQGLTLSLLLVAVPVTVAWWALLLWLAWP
jgi:hypothetical protein